MEKESTQFGVETDEFLDSQPTLVSVKKYQVMVERVAKRESKSIDVWVDDVEHWVDQEEANGRLALVDYELRQEARQLASKIEGNTMRYVGLLEELLDAMVKEEKAKNELLRPSLFSSRSQHDPTSSSQQEATQRNGASMDIGEDLTAQANGEQAEDEDEATSKSSARLVQAKLHRQ